MKKFSFREILAKIEFYVSASGFLLMILMVSVNVFARYIFNKSFSFTEELAYLGFSYSVFFGACILYRKHAMISIDIIVDRLPKKAKNIVNTITFFLLAIVCAVMIYYSTKLAIEGWVRPTAALRIPYTFVDLSAVFAFIIMTGYSIEFAIQSLRGKLEESAALEDRA
ncbi:MAG TPA: TRAP transporter small permease [Clostridiaceae bacterium]|nr:TRAP transporter small permease [Clostridiaceae bacterium]